jgi:hypothetical protein
MYCTLFFPANGNIYAQQAIMEGGVAGFSYMICTSEKQHLLQGKYNAAQRIAYTDIIIMGIGSVSLDLLFINQFSLLAYRESLVDI